MGMIPSHVSGRAYPRCISAKRCVQAFAHYHERCSAATGDGGSELVADRRGCAAAILLVKKITRGVVLFSEMNPREAMPKLLPVYEAGPIKLHELVTQKYKLDDIERELIEQQRSTLSTPNCGGAIPCRRE